MTRRLLNDTLRRPIALGAIGGAILIVVVWIFAFYAPENRKLSSVQAEQASLRAQVAADNAKVQELTNVKQHLGEIKTDYTRLLTYAPPTDELYTYVSTISAAATASGVTLSAISPSAATVVSGAPYNALPISLSISGTYDSILKMLKAIYDLPRLTDITSISISGGGTGTNRTAKLVAQLQTDIFYQATPAPTASAAPATSASTTTTTTAAP